MTDAYNKCRKCANFGTENCPESSLCFALNYKPFYKAKAKSKMKKKYRRAVCKSLTWLVKPFWWLFMVIAFPFVVTWMYCQDWEYELKTKLRVYDTDPD